MNSKPLISKKIFDLLGLCLKTNPIIRLLMLLNSTNSKRSILDAVHQHLIHHTCEYFFIDSSKQGKIQSQIIHVISE